MRILTSPGRPNDLSRIARKEAARAREGEGCDCLIEVDLGREPSSTLIGSAGAVRTGRSVTEVLPESRVAVRGGTCLVVIGPEDWIERCGQILGALGPEVRVWIAVAGASYGENSVRLLELDRDLTLSIPNSTSASGSSPRRDVADLCLREAIGFGLEPEFEDRVAASRHPVGESSPVSLARTVWSRFRKSSPGRAASESGQATLLTIGACFGALILGALLLSVAGAVTGKGRAQGAADLSALSAARSMRDDLPRLLAPPTLPNGAPNPAHMPKPVYLARAVAVARRIALANGASPVSVSIGFPDAASFAPLRARVSLPVGLRGEVRPASSRVTAEARVGVSVPYGGLDAITMATGGGYSGPLVMRQGHGMRPDVAAAFDLMANAAAASGVVLAINSGFRSDAEQARLFSANPDPRWVAPPGRSLHRCATELDIGPPAAYGWLAANAGRFGFTKRYSWEPWHFGFTAGPAPCSAAGELPTSGPSLTGRSRSGPGLLPGWVPSRYRGAIARASLATGVPAVLLAAQLRAESNFDPGAVSSAGAQGIAQFMPATAASYGLGNPFDPFASIAAQARMMAELLGEFGSPALALAAYNAGPGAVGSCRCIPPYPETEAYVAKILALTGGIGALQAPGMEVQLVG